MRAPPSPPVHMSPPARRLLLFNGLELTDAAPGAVSRYNQLKGGAWLAARLLLYVYRSFPPLWKPASRDPDDPAFAYNWRTWVDTLESMPKQLGAWSELSAHLARGGTSHGQIADIARAAIELAMRDAEIQRNALRAHPVHLAAYRIPDEPHLDDYASATDEQAFMARIRSATGYEPRVRRVEKCIYRALAVRNVALVHAVAAGAPDSCAVHDVLKEASF